MSAFEREGFSLAPTGQLRRRKAVGRAVESAMLLAALAAVAILGVLVVSVIQRGHAAITLDFFTKTPASFGFTGGGIANSIAGTAVLIAFATLFALPTGVAIAIYTSELAPPRFRRVVGFILDVLNGLPSIVIGIFIFGLLIVGHQQSALAGSAALSIIMLPLVARSTQEVLALVPASLREASDALGVSRWRTTLGIVLPSSLGGIFTGATLAIARAAGETAPLLFTCSLTTSQLSWDPRHALQSIPLTIFEYFESPNPDDHAKAWAAALVLMSFVLAISLLSKAVLARTRRKLSR
ncbi:MAG: phosphate ABC transporter permease PstA [Gaiellaceae bacterium]